MPLGSALPPSALEHVTRSEFALRASKPLLLQSPGDNRTVVGLEKHEFFARVHDHHTNIYRRLPLRRKGCRAGAVGVDLIASGDRKRGSNRPVRANGYGAFERSCSVQGQLTHSRDLADSDMNAGRLEGIGVLDAQVGAGGQSLRSRNGGFDVIGVGLNQETALVPLFRTRLSCSVCPSWLVRVALPVQLAES